MSFKRVTNPSFQVGGYFCKGPLRHFPFAAQALIGVVEITLDRIQLAIYKAIGVSTDELTERLLRLLVCVFGPSRLAPSIWNDAKKGSMRLTEKHIECARSVRQA